MTSPIAALGIHPLEVKKMSQNPAPAPFQTPARPQHEGLIEEFLELDKECQEIIEKFMNGKILFECLPPEGANTLQELMAKMVEKYVATQGYLKSQIEKRNSKLQEAQASLRAAVMAGENVVRGPDGKTTTLRCGPFEVASRTSRGFDPNVLIPLMEERGLRSRLFDLTEVDPDTGKLVPAVQQEISISYDTVKNFLREQNLEDVLGAAYEEEELTAAVTGPKELGWIGETKKKSSKK